MAALITTRGLGRAHLALVTAGLGLSVLAPVAVDVPGEADAALLAPNVRAALVADTVAADPVALSVELSLIAPVAAVVVDAATVTARAVASDAMVEPVAGTAIITVWRMTDGGWEQVSSE